MPTGICKLCLKERELQESHYVPAAFYPKNVEMEFSQPEVGWAPVEEEITAPLLCFDCEQRFNDNGESEVLQHVAGKIVKKAFPLREPVLRGEPKENYPDVKLYNGSELGLDTDKFAYFMLSLVWRGAVRSWEKPGGTFTKQLQLGDFEEPIRQYLLGERPFPADTALIVIICSDTVSRKTWFLPTDFSEAGCYNVRFQGLGLYFRAMMGQDLPEFFRRACCRSAGKWIMIGDCEARTLHSLSLYDPDE